MVGHGRRALGRRTRRPHELTFSLAILLFTYSTVLHAADLQEIPEWARAQQPVQRHAFVLAVPEYQALSPVRSAANDGPRIKTALGNRGFTIVRPEHDLTRDGILTAFDTFLERIRPGDVVLFYYSGHGFERDGAAYVAPSDLTALPPNRIGLTAISLEFFMNEIEDRGADLAVYIIDACRTHAVLPDPPPQAVAKPHSGFTFDDTGLDRRGGPSGPRIIYAAAQVSRGFGRVQRDPRQSPASFTPRLLAFGQSDQPAPQQNGDAAGAVAQQTTAEQPPDTRPPDPVDRTPIEQPGDLDIEGSGLEMIKGPSGQAIIYAAEPRRPSYGRFRSDPANEPSIFTRELLRALRQPGLTVSQVYTDVWRWVNGNTREKQRPDMNVASGYAQGLVINQNPAYRARRDAQWSAAVAAPEAEQYGLLHAFLKDHPDSVFAAAARARARELERYAPRWEDEEEEGPKV